MSFISTHTLPIFLIAISLLLAILGEDFTRHLIYNRNLINDGEFWRFITAHLTHLGWSHLLLNLSALIIIWFLIYEFLPTLYWWFVALITAISTSFCLYFFMSGLQWYVGLSGLLHGLLVCGATIGAIKKRSFFILLLIFLSIKIIYEQFYGSESTELIAGDVVVNAHLYGAVTGLVCALSFVLLKRTKPSNF